MFKPSSGRRSDSTVWRYLSYEPSVDKSFCQVPDCGSSLKGKNETNLLTHLKSKLCCVFSVTFVVFVAICVVYVD